MTDARLDLQRRQRLGMVEAVWGEHKTADQILNVLRGFEAVGEVGFVTRVDAEKARVVTSTLTSAEYHPLARCLTLGSCPSAVNTADVAVLSGGSSDAAVVAEIGLALRWQRRRHGATESVGDSVLLVPKDGAQGGRVPAEGRWVSASEAGA